MANPLNIQVNVIPKLDAAQFQTALNKLAKSSTLKSQSLDVQIKPTITQAQLNTALKEIQTTMSGYKNPVKIKIDIEPVISKTALQTAINKTVGDVYKIVAKDSVGVKADTGTGTDIKDTKTQTAAVASLNKQIDNLIYSQKVLNNQSLQGLVGQLKQVAVQLNSGEMEANDARVAFQKLSTEINSALKTPSTQALDLGMTDAQFDKLIAKAKEYQIAVNQGYWKGSDAGLNTNFSTYEEAIAFEKQLEDITKRRSNDKSYEDEAQAIAKLRTQMSDYLNLNSKMALNTSGVERIQQIDQSLASGSISANNAAKQFAEVQYEMARLGFTAETTGQRVSNLFKAHFNTAIAMLGVHALQDALMGVYTNVVNIDTAMTELKKVTSETSETYNSFLDNAGSRATDIGATLTDTINATANAARLGYDIEESEDLSDAMLVYNNVADGIENIDQASSNVISSMKAFGVEASNTMSIVDKYNEVGNNFSITSGGIGDAMMRSASALVEAGNTMDESIGLIVAANDVVQDPDVVGTAMKTLSLRIRGAKVDLEEMGEETDGMADSTSDLQEKLLALTGQQVDIMLDED